MVEHWQPTAEPLVLHVIPSPAARGAQREARALVDRLDAPGQRRHRLLCLFDGPPEVPVDLSLGWRGGRVTAAGFDPRRVWGLRRALDRLAPAVVVAHGGDPLKYLVPAGLGGERPLVYYAIGTYAGPPRGRAQLALWRALVGRAAAVAAEGEEVQRELVDRLGAPAGRVRLTPNGRDPEEFRPRSPTPAPAPAGDGPPTALFVGALNQQKGPDRFVEVIAGLRARGVELRARIAGNGPLAGALAAPAAAAGVELIGSRPDVPELMRASDLLLFPSRPAGEGMPGVLIEAGLSGLPVVATAVPGVGMIVADETTGIVVPVDDIAAMTEAAAGLLASPTRRAAMGAAAVARCRERFSLAAVAEVWRSIIEPLLPDGAPTG